MISKNNQDTKALSHYAFLLIIRFAALLAIAIVIGYHAGKGLHDSNARPSITFDNASPNIKSFILAVINFSKTELTLTLLAVVSAFTFFCPLICHTLVLAWGFIYGVRASFINFAYGITSESLIYLIFSGIFSIILIYFSAYSQNTNKRFLIGRGHSKYGVMSQDLKTYLIECIKILTTIAITQTLCVILLLYH